MTVKTYKEPSPKDSLNPTTAAPDGNSVYFDYTKRADEMGLPPVLGRHPITRDSAIDGGVYWGTYGREAIVVDGEKYPDGLNNAMNRIYGVIRSPDGTVDKSKVLRAVYDTVRNMMRYDADAVNAIFDRSGGKDYTKVALDVYVQEGVGVCRHQALFAAQILERLRTEGIVGGSVSVDRNMVRRPEHIDDSYDGHAWVRYTNSGGDIYIIDPAQGRIGLLDNLIAQRDSGDVSVWEYARPDDRERIRNKLIGQRAAAWWPSSRGEHRLYKDAHYTDGVLDRVPVWVDTLS